MILTMCSFYASFEYWAFEILIFLAGLLPDSEITTPLVAIWYGSDAFHVISVFLT